MERDRRRYVTENLGLPKDLMLGDVNIRLVGRSEALIENYRYIIEYSDCLIKLQCKNMKLKITGSHLVIEYFSKDEMLVKGRIETLVYQV